MNTPHRTRSGQAHKRFAVICALLVFCLLFASLVALSQGGQNSATQLKGKTKEVTPIPNGSVDAGQVVFKKDSDNDGMPDEDEIKNGTDPNDPSDADADNDGDGISNGDEVALGSNPNSADSDGDGMSDSDEVRLGYNPLDPTSTPPQGAAVVSLSIAPTTSNVVLNSVLGQQPVALRVTGVLNNGSTVDLTNVPGTMYSTGDPSVAVIDDSHKVVGITPGFTSVTVRNGNLSTTVPAAVIPFTPQALSRLQLPGFGFAVDVSGSHAYVAAGAAGLQVVDVSDHSAPTIVASSDTPGIAFDVRVIGDLAYVADNSSLQILNVADPAAPTLVGSVSTTDARHVVVSGTRAYTAGSIGLDIIDVSTPSAPVLLRTAFAAGSVDAVDVVNTRAFVASGQTLKVIDVSDPSIPPPIIGSVALPVSASALVVRGSTAYVTLFNGGMETVDVGDPSAPRVVGSLPFNSSLGFIGTDLALSGDFAFASDAYFASGVPVVNVKDAAAPLNTGVLDFSGFGAFLSTSIALEPQYIYLIGDSRIFGDNRTSLVIGQYQPPVEDNAEIAPTISLTTPAEGGQVGEGDQLYLSADAADDVYVAGVQFLVDGQIVATDFTAPYEVTVTVPVGAPTRVVSAVAIDLGARRTIVESRTINVIASPPPTVSILNPAEGAQLIEGQSVLLSAAAEDDQQVAQVAFAVNGVALPPLSNSPYEQTYTVPSGITSLNIVATATDNVGKTATDSRTLNVIPDPGTTVNGRVLNEANEPVGNVTVTVFGQYAGSSAGDGTFSVTGVPTIRGGVVARVTTALAGVPVSGASSRVTPTVGGVTDVGTIVLSPLISAPTAAGAATFSGDDVSDLFVGYSDRPTGLLISDGNGAFATSSDFALPFTIVSVGAVLGNSGLHQGTGDATVFAQVSGQPGSVVSIYSNSAGELQPATSLATGLSHECDSMAVARDSDHRPVIAFLSTTGGTALTVRFGSIEFAVAPTFDEPVVLPTDPNARLRALSLADVTGDGLLDLIAVKPLVGNAGRLVVYPRISATSFGDPVESPITLRSSDVVGGEADYAIGALVGASDADVAVLGDDWVRIYRGDGSGAFLPEREITLPDDETPTGITARPLTARNNDDLLVTTASLSSPGAKSLRVYLNQFGADFGTPQIFSYTAQNSGGDVRIVVGYWNDPGSAAQADVVIIDGTTVKSFLQVGPGGGVD